MQKKFIFSLFLAIILGSLLGHTLFEQFKEEDQEVFAQNDVIYFLEEGIYDNLERAEAATKDIDTKIIVKEDANYYVYLAITKNKSNLSRLKKIYKDMNLNINVKEMEIEDTSFLTSLEQMDGLVEKTTTKEELLTITKVVLANYEELVLKR